MKSFPNFFIVGAAKSGTTSLYRYLAQHPNIYLSRVKEPKYFSVSANKFPHKGPGDIDVDNTVVKTWHEYQRLFSDAKYEKRIGEASADYLYFYQSVIPSIKRFNPDVKIIIILRNPTERAYSAYRHLVRDKRETLSFEDGLDAEEHRKRQNYEFIWFYKDVGFYHRQVEAYLYAFGDENVKIYLYEAFLNNPLEVIKDVCIFLGVESDFVPDMLVKYNSSKMPLNKPFEQFLENYEHPFKKLLRPVLLSAIGKANTENIVNFFKNINTKKIESNARKHLIEVYKEDILKLQDLIKQDLTSWLE